jgi:hypothetical protein
MPAYRNTPPVNNPVQPFELTPFQPRQRKDLNGWVTRALATVKPWQWDIRRRLARVWDRNPNHDQGQHSKERQAREERLRGNLKMFERIKGGMLATRLPGRLHASALAVSHQVSRLLHGGDWWQARRLVNHATGEVVETIYLPEDTWSAEAAFDWCVSMLARLVSAAWGMTEKTTPRYKPRETENGSQRGRPARIGDFMAELTAKWGSRGAGGQPELPSTT